MTIIWRIMESDLNYQVRLMESDLDNILVITLRTTPCSAGVRLKHLVWNFFTWLMEPFITLHASCHPLLTIIRITAWTINWNSLWLCSSRNYHLFWKRCKKFFLLGTPESETLTWFGHNDNLLDHCHYAKSVAYAIENKPQSELPFWNCVLWILKVIIDSFDFMIEATCIFVLSKV